MSNRERLEFIIRFVQTDSTKLSEQDWHTLYVELWEFLKPTGSLALGFPVNEVSMKEEIAALTKCGYEMLADVVHAREDTLFAGKITDNWKPSLGHDVNLHFDSSPMVGPRVTASSLRDVFLFVLFTLITQEPTDKIRRCGASDCNRIFYRERRQNFCSERCQTRDFMRRWRQEPENGAKDAEKAHTRYKRKKQKKLGAKTKVGRRPRRKPHGN